MYCKYCGKTIDDDSKYCVNCGSNMNYETFETMSGDRPSKAFGVLGFFMPIVGLVLYAVYERKQPQRAKSAGRGALIGFITAIVFSVITFALGLGFTSSMMKSIMGDINTFAVESVEETASFDAEFGEFEVSKNAYTYDTSLEMIVTNKSDKQKTFYITVEAVDEDGVRIGTDSVMADRLNPNQKIKLYVFKFVPQDKIEQYKAAKFQVLDVVEY